MRAGRGQFSTRKLFESLRTHGELPSELLGLSIIIRHHFIRIAANHGELPSELLGLSIIIRHHFIRIAANHASCRRAPGPEHHNPRSFFAHGQVHGGRPTQA